jgi:hypothetical protein
MLSAVEKLCLSSLGELEQKCPHMSTCSVPYINTLALISAYIPWLVLNIKICIFMFN